MYTKLCFFLHYMILSWSSIIWKTIEKLMSLTSGVFAWCFVLCLCCPIHISWVIFCVLSTILEDRLCNSNLHWIKVFHCKIKICFNFFWSSLMFCFALQVDRIITECKLNFIFAGVILSQSMCMSSFVSSFFTAILKKLLDWHFRSWQVRLCFLTAVIPNFQTQWSRSFDSSFWRSN